MKYPEIILSLDQKGITHDPYQPNNFTGSKIRMDHNLVEWLVVNIGDGCFRPDIFENSKAKWCLTLQMKRHYNRNYKKGYRHIAAGYRLMVKPGLDAQLLLFKLTCGEK